MERNIILAGVGGQGILTIAHVISAAAMRRGWHVKQAEVHGMSQRGGAVYSHLRLADHPIYSDLIPEGECDLIVAMEPLEGLRYTSYLRENAAILTSIAPVMNIPNYPQVDELFTRIAEAPDHVLIDADRLARAAGAGLGANSALLGAMSSFLDLRAEELEEALGQRLAAKGERIVEANRKAFRLGLKAAAGYRDGRAHGVAWSAMRDWVQTVSPEDLFKSGGNGHPAAPVEPAPNELTGGAKEAIGGLLDSVHRTGRTQLREHEIYEIVAQAGAIHPPRHLFVPTGASLDAPALAAFPGDKVVLKVVSSEVIHKSDSGGVVFVRKSPEAINTEIKRLHDRQAERGAQLDGVLIVEFVEHDDAGFGNELLVGIRASRSFGPVIVAGVGGIDTEYLAERMRPGLAAARAIATDTTAEVFFEIFKSTAAYDVLSGKARGHLRVVSDGELLHCFRAFLGLAREFCVDRGAGRPSITELEVNPFAFVHQRMVPLDGRGRLGRIAAPAPPRPQAHIQAMLEPESIALIGASAQRVNFARIILNNIVESGFPIENLHVIHPEAHEIDGVRCIRNIKFTAEPIDLLVAAVAAESAPRVVQDAIDSGRVRSIILIPGGLGETEGSESLQSQIQAAVHASRKRSDGGPVILGGNCLGVRSRPGRYDTFFIPPEKMDPRRGRPASPLALITQSGAFAITRMSNLESVNPAITVTLGNQTDLTASDMVRAVGEREDIRAIGVYVEGFNVLDGLELTRAVEEVTAAGKVVVFYKAGRTPQGRSASAGHTASIAGDYDVCQAALAAAGAIVVDTFKEFEQLVELATLFATKRVGGRRLAAITNAGAEAVGIADTIQGPRYRVELARFQEATVSRIREALAAAKLDKLVNVTNPLDVNPMANESVYDESIRAMIFDPQVDAVVVALVPFTPYLLTTPTELNDPKSLAARLPAIFRDSTKPLLVVIDAGRPYDVMARALRQEGIPVFPCCDQAIRSLGRYLHYFASRN